MYLINEEVNEFSTTQEVLRLRGPSRTAQAFWQEEDCCSDCLRFFCWWRLFSDPQLLEFASPTPFSFCLSSSGCHPQLSLLFLRPVLTSSIPILLPITGTWGLSPLMCFPQLSLFCGTSSAMRCFFGGCSPIFLMDDTWWTRHSAILVVPNARGEEPPQPWQCLDGADSLDEQEG